jgi:hypothetical protein
MRFVDREENLPLYNKIHSRTYRIKAAHGGKIRRTFLHDGGAGGSGFEQATAVLPRRLLHPSPTVTDEVSAIIFYSKKGGFQTGAL